MIWRGLCTMHGISGFRGLVHTKRRSGPFDISHIIYNIKRSAGIRGHPGGLEKTEEQ